MRTWKTQVTHPGHSTGINAIDHYTLPGDDVGRRGSTAYYDRGNSLRMSEALAWCCLHYRGNAPCTSSPGHIRITMAWCHSFTLTYGVRSFANERVRCRRPACMVLPPLTHNPYKAASACTISWALTTLPCRGNTFSISSLWTSGSRSAHPSSTTMSCYPQWDLSLRSPMSSGRGGVTRLSVKFRTCRVRDPYMVG